MFPIGNPSRNARKRNPTAAHRRALELLAIADGATEAILLAHGFTIELMVELIRARLATQAERLVAGSRTFDVAWVSTPREALLVLGDIACQVACQAVGAGLAGWGGGNARSSATA
jgi:hypothetical protein